MERCQTGVARWRKELGYEETEEMIQNIQSLQVKFHGLSTQWLTMMEILAKQRQEKNQLKDEQASIRSDVEELKN